MLALVSIKDFAQTEINMSHDIFEKVGIGISGSVIVAATILARNMPEDFVEMMHFKSIPYGEN